MATIRTVREHTKAASTQARAGIAACAWALGYLPIHVYWALSGSASPFGELPESLTTSEWRQANWGACVVIVGAAVVSLALAQPWGRNLPRPVLTGVAWVGAAFAILHWIAFSAATLLNMTGITDGAVTSFDRWNLFVFEPWFLGMGVLLAVTATRSARANQGSEVPRPSSTPHSLPGIASVALIVGGSFVVLVGVMTFRVWVYALAGPVVLGMGVLGLVLTRRARRPS